MAEEFNEGRIDLNLYLGLARPPPRNLESFGPDLTLVSTPYVSPAMEDGRMTSQLPPLNPSRAFHTNGTRRSPRPNVPPSFIAQLPPLADVEILDVPYAPFGLPNLPGVSDLPNSSNSSLSHEFSDGASLHLDPLQNQESQFQRLTDLNRRLRARRFRSSLSHGLDRSVDRGLPDTERLIHDIMNPQTCVRINGKDKVVDTSFDVDHLEEEQKEKSRNVANFECNICLDVSKDPVVTLCGHLFCWPCLYQWLHVHSVHRECPVCKGEVLDANIVPIYGRGNVGGDDKKRSGDGDSSLIIPSRPHGHRLESLRQQLLQRPSLVELLQAQHRVLARMMQRRLRREEGNVGSGTNARDIGQSGNSISNTQIGAMESAMEDDDAPWRRLTLQGIGLTERLASISADLDRVVERLGGSNQAGTSTSENPRNHEPDDTSRDLVAAVTHISDQAVVSSTIAFTEGDVARAAITADIDGAGSSRPLRRRGRSRALSSLDVDEISRERRRRRLN